MFFHKQIQFLPQQESYFLKKHKRLPSPAQFAELSAPVVQLELTYVGTAAARQIICPILAILDTGADRTAVRLASLVTFVRRTFGGWPTNWIKMAGGYEWRDVTISINGRALTGDSLQFLREDVWPGYEEAIVGRDILNSCGFCYHAGTFSLMDATGRPQTLPIADPCCRQ